LKKSVLEQTYVGANVNRPHHSEKTFIVARTNAA
jgi:hypothetical protein